jgi:HEPN domain-containing protein
VYAAEDLVTAEKIARSRTMPPRNACYHAQQTVEKALKAALIFRQIRFPFRHDLNELRDLLPTGWNVKTQHPNLSALTLWVVEARYPSGLPDATRGEAQAAVREARRVYETIRADMIGHGFTL